MAQFVSRYRQPQWMSRKKSVTVVPRPPKVRAQMTDEKWNQLIYDRINGIEKGEESTKLQKPLRLGRRKSLRRRVRAFRVRVSKFRLRIRFSPHLWLKNFCDAYVRMMLGMQDSLGGSGGFIVGFHGALPTACPSRRRL